MSSTIMPVAQRGLQRCLRLGAHGRVQQRFHSSAPSPTASPLSVAKLLATPADDGERQVYGFVRSIRKQKTRAFAAIGDGSSLESLQALLTPAQAERSVFTQSPITLQVTNCPTQPRYRCRRPPHRPVDRLPRQSHPGQRAAREGRRPPRRVRCRRTYHLSHYPVSQN